MMSAIVDHLWQSTLFAIVAWLLTLVLRNNAARVRYWVWLTASIKFLIPFSLLTMLGSQFSWQSDEPAAASNIFFATVQQLAEPLVMPEIVLRSTQAQSFDFLPIVLSIWVLGSALLLARWGMCWFRVVAAVRSAEPVAIQSPITVKSSPVMFEPGVVGVLRPVLLLPEGIAARLTASQMQAILAHELCHVRRRDNLTAAVHMIVEVLFWFHPMVWWIGARLVEERERACDEGVVELGNEPQAYAEGILKVCQFYMESKLVCVAGVSGANLKTRVESIMKNRIVDSLGVVKKWLLASAGAAVVFVPLVLGIGASPSSLAQAGSAASRAFDEVSIRPGDLHPLPSGPNQQWLYHDKGNITVKNLPLSNLVAFANGIDVSRVVGGPDWAYSLMYSVDAKSAVPLKPDGTLAPVPYEQMVLSLLRDRFALQSHRETRQVSVYVMTAGQPDLMQAKIAPPPEWPADLPAWLKRGSSITPDRTGLVFQSASMSDLAKYLSHRLGRTVVDQTELKGKYNFGLTGKEILLWDRNKMTGTDPLPAAVEQQLGLKLEPQMAPVEVVVIDFAQQPTVNAPSVSTVDSQVQMAAGSPSDERERLLKERLRSAAAQRAVTGIQRSTYPSDASRFIVPATALVRATPRATTAEMGAGPIVQFQGSAFSATNTTLKELITTAYGGAPGQVVGGPTWIDTARFDVTLKLAPPDQLPDFPEEYRGTRMESWQGMQVQLKELLADRFKLVLRRESNVVYTLVAATDGVKLQRSIASALDWRGVREDGQSVIAQNATTQDLISVLSARLARPVLNRTALGDGYDFELRLPANAPPIDAQRLSGALREQLGLSLGTIDIPTMVVERATKPGENI